MNWEGQPLRSLGVMLAYIRGTTTKAGLTVSAHLDEAVYKKAQQVSKAEMDRIGLVSHRTCPAWNYTLRRRPNDL
jgi:hypothetical protein